MPPLLVAARAAVGWTSRALLDGEGGFIATKKVRSFTPPAATRFFRFHAPVGPIASADLEKTCPGNDARHSYAHEKARKES